MKRLAVVLILSILLSAQVWAEFDITGEDVVYHVGSDSIGYLTQPAEPGEYPGLILIHEWWGLNDQIKKEADRYAKLGYVALAVDLYDGESATTASGARQLAGRVSGNMEAAFSNLRSAVEFLKASEGVDSDHLGSVGWCFGGGWSYQMAKNDLGVQASVIYYGRFNPADDLGQMRALILGNFGEEDRSISVDSVKEFQAKLKTLNGEHEVYIYPNAGHAFANDESGAYDREAAELAWERTTEFLKDQLGD